MSHRLVEEPHNLLGPADISLDGDAPPASRLDLGHDLPSRLGAPCIIDDDGGSVSRQARLSRPEHLVP
jgi:hypothetical protein